MPGERATNDRAEVVERDCEGCAQGDPRDECLRSRRPCGHHCNHSWTHDLCDWCNETWGDEDEEATP